MSNYNLSRLNVILVEKHTNMRLLLRRVLEELGIKMVRDSRDPVAAFRMHLGEPADLVLTDWAPGLDGLGLLGQLRRGDDSPDPFVPVIVVTANTEMKHVIRARDMGMTEFLAKPISAKLLYSRIRSIIEKRRLFVKNNTFFGPDRRRRRMELDGPDRRSHANFNGPERRTNVIPFPGTERRQGYVGYEAPDKRAASMR